MPISIRTGRSVYLRCNRQGPEHVLGRVANRPSGRNWAHVFDIRPVSRSLCRALKRYDLPRMQLNLKAEQRSERAFRECQARLKTYDPRLFIFLDETHVDITRLTSLGGS